MAGTEDPELDGWVFRDVQQALVMMHAFNYRTFVDREDPGAGFLDGDLLDWSAGDGV